MTRENLIKLIEEREKIHDSALVSIEEFFEDNVYRWSFAANACNNDVDVFTFNRIFRDLEQLKSVQFIEILIVDIDDEEEWPYSDTAFISTSLNEKEIESFFGKAFPSEITEINVGDPILKQIKDIKEGFKLYCLWWD